MRNIIRHIAVGFILCISPATGILYGGVVVNSSMNLDQLTITPSSGSLNIILPWTATGFAQALDSLGGFDQQFNSIDNGSASAAAATALASASGGADALAQTATAFSGIFIPNIEAFASSTGRGSFFGVFQIDSVDPDPISVQFTALLFYDQLLQTNGTGLSASSEVVFSLNLDSGDQPLFLDNIISIGPNTTVHAGQSPTLNGSATLNPNTPYTLFLEVDSESSGVSAPEPSTLLLMLGSFTLLLAMRRKPGSDIGFGAVCRNRLSDPGLPNGIRPQTGCQTSVCPTACTLPLTDASPAR